MLITEFLQGYKKAVDKTEFVKEHVVTDYIPYERKMAICKNIIQGADYSPNIDVINKNYYCPNTPMRFVLFCMSIVDAYTDIELEQLEEGKRDVMGGYNKLDAEGVFEVLFKELQKEYSTMNTVLQMMTDDTFNRENNLVSFLSTKFDSIKALYDTVPSLIQK